MSYFCAPLITIVVILQYVRVISSAVERDSWCETTYEASCTAIGETCICLFGPSETVTRTTACSDKEGYLAPFSDAAKIHGAVALLAESEYTEGWIDGFRTNALVMGSCSGVPTVADRSKHVYPEELLAWAPDQPDCTCDYCSGAELYLQVEIDGIHDISWQSNKPYFCELDKDECAENDVCGSDINNKTLTCVNNFGGYECVCSDGLVLREGACVQPTPTQTLTPTHTTTPVLTETATPSDTAVIDKTPPVALCRPAVRIALSNTGFANLQPEDVDLGSYDAETGIQSTTLYPKSFACSEVGTTVATLTVTDFKGNAATCDIQLTVEDIIPPEAVCNDIAVPRISDIYKRSSLEALTDNSYDGCGIPHIGVTIKDQLKSNVVRVQLRLIDAHRNIASCFAEVTLLSATATVSATSSSSPTASYSPTYTSTLENTYTRTPTATVTQSPTGTRTPQLTPTTTSTISPTTTRSISTTRTRSQTMTSTITVTGTPTATTTLTNTGEVTITPTPDLTPTGDPTPTVHDLVGLLLSRQNAGASGVPNQQTSTSNWVLIVILSSVIGILLVVILVIVFVCKKYKNYRYWNKHGKHFNTFHSSASHHMNIKTVEAGEQKRFIPHSVDVKSSLDSSASTSQSNPFSFTPFTPGNFTAIVPKKSTHNNHHNNNNKQEQHRYHNSDSFNSVSNPLAVPQIQHQPVGPELQVIRDLVVQSFMGIIHDDNNAFPVTVDKLIQEINEGWNERVKAGTSNQFTAMMGVKLLAVIYVYSSRKLKVGRTINAALHTANGAQVSQFRPFHDVVLDQLRMLPLYCGTVYKGIPSALTLQDGYRRGSCVPAIECVDATFYGHVALQRAIADDSYRSGGCTVFIIESLHGKNVSAYSPSSDIEVVFPPGTKFEVMKALTNPNDKKDMVLHDASTSTPIDWSCIFVYLLRERWDSYAPPPPSAQSGFSNSLNLNTTIPSNMSSRTGTALGAMTPFTATMTSANNSTIPPVPSSAATSSTRTPSCSTSSVGQMQPLLPNLSNTNQSNPYDVCTPTTAAREFQRNVGESGVNTYSQQPPMSMSHNGPKHSHDIIDEDMCL